MSVELKNNLEQHQFFLVYTPLSKIFDVTNTGLLLQSENINQQNDGCTNLIFPIKKKLKNGWAVGNLIDSIQLSKN